MLNIALRNSGLLHKSQANIYIHLRDHNKKINTKLVTPNVSYRDPRTWVPNAPVHKFIQYKLIDAQEQLLERKIFQQYKEKLLTGVVDPVQEKPIDPLWGQNQIPIHYHAKMSKKHLMHVSHPESRAFRKEMDQIYQNYFKSSLLEQEITKQVILNSNYHQIVEISLLMRNQNILDASLWFQAEKILDRGKKLYLLSDAQLIKVKFAFDGFLKFGTPIFHEILSDLLKDAIEKKKFSKDQLIYLFYASRHSNPGKTNLQQQCLKALDSHFVTFSFDQKIKFLQTYVYGSDPLRLDRRKYKKRSHQHRNRSSLLVFKLNFWDLQLNQHNVNKLVVLFAQLRILNTKFVTIPLKQYIQTHYDQYVADSNRLFNAIAFMPLLEGGQGIYCEELYKKFRETAIQRWESWQPIQKIRIIHAFWNFKMMDERLQACYRQLDIPIESTMLHYFCQIQLQYSSEREWKIIQNIAYLDYVPLPYFVTYKRFYNYIRGSTNWNLQPLQDKLKNTQYYFDVLRNEDNLSDNRIYTQLKSMEDWTGVHFIPTGIPIDNIEMTHFAYGPSQVSLDLIGPKQFIPGTKTLKETYLNKMRSLKSIYWMPLAFDQQQVSKLNLGSFIEKLLTFHKGYEQSQRQLMQYEYSKRCQVYELQQFYSHINIMDGRQQEEFMNLEWPQLVKQAKQSLQRRKQQNL